LLDEVEDEDSEQENDELEEKLVEDDDDDFELDEVEDEQEGISALGSSSRSIVELLGSQHP
jgi:hypothetical protein